MRHGCFFGIFTFGENTRYARTLVRRVPWCLFEGDELIGMVAVRYLDNDKGIAELKRLYILPEYQGKCYGGLLFGLTIDYTKEQGYRIIRADTRHDRAASLHLIEKYRFRRIEQYNDNAFAELYFELELE